MMPAASSSATPYVHPDKILYPAEDSDPLGVQNRTRVHTMHSVYRSNKAVNNCIHNRSLCSAELKILQQQKTVKRDK